MRRVVLRALHEASTLQAMPYRIVQTQPTPNPNALKFLLDREVSPGTLSFLSPLQADDHPLAKRLFGVQGVASLMFLGDFITVNKQPQAAWADVTPGVRKVLETPPS